MNSRHFILDPQLVGSCFAFDNMITLADNMKKPISDIKVGDVVKAIDTNGNIVDSEITAIMHKESDVSSELSH